MEYLLFLKIGIGLIGALAASIYIWSKNGSTTIQKPIKTENGDYLINTPDDLEGITFDDKIKID
jgi:hypothetical protein